MFVGSKEYRFPDEAPEAFRRAMFGEQYVAALDSTEAKTLAQLQHDLTQVRRLERGLGIIQTVQRYVLQKIFAKQIDQLALATLNTELKANNYRNDAPVYPREKFPLLNQFADEAAAELPAKVDPLRVRAQVAKSQREQSDGLLREELIKGRLRFWMLNHNTGELLEGRPTFWRSDAAREAWAGKRVVNGGAPCSAIVLAGDIAAFFGRSEETSLMPNANGNIPSLEAAHPICTRESDWTPSTLLQSDILKVLNELYLAGRAPLGTRPGVLVHAVLGKLAPSAARTDRKTILKVARGAGFID